MRIFFAFFFVSGLCSLIYQVVWLRLSMAEFGVTTPLVSIVLSVFMGGLAIGSRLGGYVARRIERSSAAVSLRLYAATELTIGFSGVIVPWAIRRGRGLLGAIGGDVSWASSAWYLGAGAWIALCLVPFCTCMGATFPLIMSSIRKTVRNASERSFSFLYLANVLGATTGTLLSAFVLIELLGFHRTLYLTAALNGLVAAGAILISRRVPAEDAGGAEDSVGIVAASGAAPKAASLSDSPSGAALAGVPIFLFTTGLISLAMEVVWIRQFTAYLGTWVYAFASILAIYLLATSAGSTLCRRRNSSRPGDGSDTLWRFAWISLGALALLPLLAADPRLPLSHSPLAQGMRIVLGIVPFSAALGFLTPMMVDRWSRGDPERAGSVYALNVLGCIVGPLLGGFLLLPRLGERWTLVALSLPLFLIGWIATAGAAPKGGWWTRLGNVCALVLSLVLIGTTRDFETIFTKPIVRRDATATVVAAEQGGRKWLLVNGVGITSLTPITKFMAHLPAAFLPRTPENSLTICLGMGTSFRSLLSWGIKATAVELVPSVPSVIGFFHADGEALLRSPRAKVVVDDGRRFLERTKESFDVITIDPPPPVEAAGSSLLYSREFYASARKRLRPGGILQQWLPRAEPAIVVSVTRALRDSFPSVRAFGSIEGWGYHFLASDSPLPQLSPSALASRLPETAARDLLEWGPETTVERQFAGILAREVAIESLERLASGIPTLRDDRPVNEYFFLRRFVFTRQPDAQAR